MIILIFERVSNIINIYIYIIKFTGTSCEIERHRTYLMISKLSFRKLRFWCRHAGSHYLGHCLYRSISSYGVTRPQGVKNNGCMGTNNFLWNITGRNVNSLLPSDACMCIHTVSIYGQVIACRLFGDKRTAEAILPCSYKKLHRYSKVCHKQMDIDIFCEL